MLAAPAWSSSEHYLIVVQEEVRILENLHARYGKAIRRLGELIRERY